MSNFTSEQGGLFFPYTPKESHPLEAKTYTAVQTDDGFALKLMESNFEHKGRIYGDATLQHDRTISTYDGRGRSMGIAMSGEKGSGKTVLAKLVATTLRERGMPTVMVTSRMFGPGFDGLIGSLGKPCCIVFDEFEKIYKEDEQERILTLLDGITSLNHMFVFTVNSELRVTQFMRSRTGRIFYWFDFTCLDEDTIRTYCEEHLENKDNIESVVRASEIFYPFNFDLLMSLVSEMNRYNENALDATRFLNVALSRNQTFVGTVKIDGVPISKSEARVNARTGNHPLMMGRDWFNVEVNWLRDKNGNLPKDRKDADIYFEFSKDTYKGCARGSYIFEIMNDGRLYEVTYAPYAASNFNKSIVF